MTHSGPGRPTLDSARAATSPHLRSTPERFTSTAVDRADKVEWFGETLSETCVPVSLVPSRDSGSGKTFAASATRHWLDDLAVVDTTTDPCMGARTRTHVARSEDDYFALVMILSGREAVADDQGTSVLGAGDAVLWDTSKPCKFEVLEPVRKRTLLMPRSALDEVVGRAWLASGVRLNQGASAVQLLTSYLASLTEALPTLQPAAISAARNATLHLVIGAARPKAMSSGASSDALRVAMNRWIDSHLLDQALSADAIAHAHSVSVRTVHRAFGREGQSLGTVVRTRRLARAREELLGSEDPISNIAHRWGFSDASHFSRLFKGQFGMSPSDYRARAQSRTSIAVDLDPVARHPRAV